MKVSEKTEKAASKTAEVTSQKTEKVIEKAEDMQDTLSPVFAQIKDDVLSGYKNKIKGHIEKALSDGHKALSILNQCLIPAIKSCRGLF